MPKIKKIGKQKNKKASNVVPLRRGAKHFEAPEPVLSVEEQERKRTNETIMKLNEPLRQFIIDEFLPSVTLWT